MTTKLAILSIFVLACLNLPMDAQYIGDQFPGITGLKAGSQPPPGFYVELPLYYRDHSITINDAQGNQVAKNTTADINLFMLPAVEVITPFKVLGHGPRLICGVGH
jgi:hypothetical protein